NADSESRSSCGKPMRRGCCNPLWLTCASPAINELNLFSREGSFATRARSGRKAPPPAKQYLHEGQLLSSGWRGPLRRPIRVFSPPPLHLFPHRLPPLVVPPAA